MSSLTKYNGKFLVPVSTVTINTTYGQTRDTECVRPLHTIDIMGALIYNAGSPTSSGTFANLTSDECETINSDERLNSLLAKHCALVELFSENYQQLELGTTTGSPNLTAYPRILGLSLTDTSKPSYWLYTINLEADDLFCSGVSINPSCSGNIRSYDESWDITYDEGEFLSEYGGNRLFRISHQLSAIGSTIAGSGGIVGSPYENAKDFVCNRKGQNAIVPTVCISGFNCSGIPLYNYGESHNVNKVAGSYSMSESWLCSPTPYIESYSIDIQTTSDQACPTVSIQGAIKGLDIRSSSGVIDSGNSRYYNSNTRFESLVSSTGFLTRAQQAAGVTLDPNVLSGTTGKNTITGDISYNYSYRSLPFKWLPSAKYEKVSVSNNWGVNGYATIGLLGIGEVIQPVFADSSGNTIGYRLKNRTLNLDATYPCDQIYPNSGISIKGPRFSSGSYQEIQDLVSYYHPSGDSGVNPLTVQVDSQQETWDAQNGAYSYSVTWAFQNSGMCG